jgi:hypothetical protein
MVCNSGSWEAFCKAAAHYEDTSPNEKACYFTAFVCDHKNNIWKAFKRLLQGLYQVTNISHPSKKGGHASEMLYDPEVYSNLAGTELGSRRLGRFAHETPTQIWVHSHMKKDRRKHWLSDDSGRLGVRVSLTVWSHSYHSHRENKHSHLCKYQVVGLLHVNLQFEACTCFYFFHGSSVWCYTWHSGVTALVLSYCIRVRFVGAAISVFGFRKIL